MPHDWLTPWEAERDGEAGHPSVVSVRSGEPYDEFVGYPSEWCNPYRMKRSGLSRDGAVGRFIVYLCFERFDLFARLPELKGKVLRCYCDEGLRCHGRVLAALAAAPPPWLEEREGVLVERRFSGGGIP